VPIDVLLAGLRRFGILVALACAVTVAVSAVLALATGQPVRRSVAVGLYVVGAVCVMLGFFAGNRPPVSAEHGDTASLFGGLIVRGSARWVTPEEQRDRRSTSALFVALGLALLAAGIAVDGRYSVA
jgi:MFS family permease